MDPRLEADLAAKGWILAHPRRAASVFAFAASSPFIIAALTTDTRSPRFWPLIGIAVTVAAVVFAGFGALAPRLIKHSEAPTEYHYFKRLAVMLAVMVGISILGLLIGFLVAALAGR